MVTIKILELNKKCDYRLFYFRFLVLVFYNLIKRIEPTYITKGGDYEVEDVVGNDLAEVVIIPTLQGFSTTDTLRRLNNDTVKWLC